LGAPPTCREVVIHISNLWHYDKYYCPCQFSWAPPQRSREVSVVRIQCVCAALFYDPKESMLCQYLYREWGAKSRRFRLGENTCLTVLIYLPDGTGFVSTANVGSGSAWSRKTDANSMYDLTSVSDIHHVSNNVLWFVTLYPMVTVPGQFLLFWTWMFVPFSCCV
jgi:hypothetical protein